MFPVRRELVAINGYVCLGFEIGPSDMFARSYVSRGSLHATFWTRYRVGDYDLLHQIAVGFEANRLPGFRGEWVQLQPEMHIIYIIRPYSGHQINVLFLCELYDLCEIVSR